MCAHCAEIILYICEDSPIDIRRLSYRAAHIFNIGIQVIDCLVENILLIASLRRDESPRRVHSVMSVFLVSSNDIILNVIRFQSASPSLFIFEPFPIYYCFESTFNTFYSFNFASFLGSRKNNAVYPLTQSLKFSMAC